MHIFLKVLNNIYDCNTIIQLNLYLLWSIFNNHLTNNLYIIIHGSSNWAILLLLSLINLGLSLRNLRVVSCLIGKLIYSLLLIKLFLAHRLLELNTRTLHLTFLKKEFGFFLLSEYISKRF